MHGSAILHFVTDEKNDFNHRVDNMMSLIKNIKLQGTFRNSCQII